MEFVTSFFDYDDHTAIPMFPSNTKEPIKDQDSLLSMLRKMDSSCSACQGTGARTHQDLEAEIHPVYSEYKGLCLKEVLLNCTDDWLWNYDDQDNLLLSNLFLEEDTSPPLVSLAPTPSPEALSPKKRPREKEESPLDTTEVSCSEDTLGKQIFLPEDSFDAQCFRSYQTGKWADKYNELCEFRQQEGHCLVPHPYEDNLSLARWVKRQRYQCKLKLEGKASTMTDKRILSLESIDFVWDTQGAAWYERLNDLKTFAVLVKHCNVPSNYPDKQLATWVKCQRRQFKLLNEGKPSNITLQRVQELEDIGFEWVLRNYKKPRSS
jgi:hypothetical protein